MTAAAVARVLSPQHPNVAVAIGAATAVIVGFGGLWGVWWVVFPRIDFVVLGYRVRERWLDRRQFEGEYQERVARGSIRSLPFRYYALGGEYSGEVHLLSRERWDEQAPWWAKGRRAEIEERIHKCLGADIGVRVRFVDAKPSSPNDAE